MSRSGLLDALVESVLADLTAAFVHDRLRSLVGEDWLKRHDLSS